jgi:hypothetical protein
MSNITKPNIDHTTIEQVLVMGDLARLTPEQRNIYYKQVCESCGLNPLTRPFEFITLNGKLTLYARKDCTDQLRKIHTVSVRIIDRSVMDDLMVVTAEATDKTGRCDSSIGAVSIANLRGEAKANALMKAETKARRRVTLSICGLGFTDESELESIPNARAQIESAPTLRPSDMIVQQRELPPAASTVVVAAPVATPAAAPESDPVEDGASGYTIIDVADIVEHKNRAGVPVWKVTSAGGQSYACSDATIVSDLSDARAQDRPVRIEWQRRRDRLLILDAKVVAE